MTRNRSMPMVAATTAVLMIAISVAISGAAFAQGGDVCVSVKGDTKVQKGDAACLSDPSSKAVAVNGSAAVAGSGSHAVATGDCFTEAFDGARTHC